MRAASCWFIVVSVETANPRERMLAGVPATTRMLEIEGIATAVAEAGDGSGLLLLHGGIECGGAMLAPMFAGLAAWWCPTSPASASRRRYDDWTRTRSPAGSMVLLACRLGRRFTAGHL